MSGMGYDEVSRLRLLPWTGAHGRPCLLLTDGDGTVSRFADRVEDVQLGLGERLLSRVRDALPAGHVNAGEFDALATRLADALGDALRIARSRGARLGGEERSRSGAVSAVTSAEEISLGLSAPGGPSAPRAYGLMSFPGHDLASAPAARRYVRDTVSLWGLPPGVTDDVETITGELVANALEHSDSHTVTVACVLLDGMVTVSVTDEGTGRTPTAQVASPGPGPGQERGRGLLITDALAGRWGTGRTRGGLTVWAEVAVETLERAAP